MLMLAIGAVHNLYYFGPYESDHSGGIIPI